VFALRVVLRREDEARRLAHSLLSRELKHPLGAGVPRPYDPAGVDCEYREINGPINNPPKPPLVIRHHFATSRKVVHPTYAFFPALHRSRSALRISQSSAPR
jgi:hypothetical protein